MPAKNRDQQAAYDARRKRSEQLLVRLAPEAQRVREAAASSGLSLSEFVLALADGRPNPIVDSAGRADFVGRRGTRR